MIHLKSDLRYFEFIYNMASNFWFVHNINDEEKKFLKGWHQVEGEEAAKDDEGDEVEVHVDVHLTVGL